MVKLEEGWKGVELVDGPVGRNATELTFMVVAEPLVD